MNNTLTKNILDWILATSMVLAVVFFVQYFFRSRELRSTQSAMQANAAKYQNNHNAINLLLAETAKYAETHPDINPVLKSFTAGATQHNSSQKPAGK
ncbi:MAG TPA: hypothetical protein VFM25_10390 [Verrucomicrobiae bacterium]|nr:hypothetical protein [Verrucomicrobiae bacterium]